MSSQKKILTYVALLRGVNVGGNTPVSMLELKESFEKLGFTSVKTYINSGNVIFKSPEIDPRKLEEIIEKKLVEDFSYPIKVVIRSFGEMQKIISQIPKSWKSSKEQKCNVIFLRHSIDNNDILKGLEIKEGIEELYYHPGVLFWSATTSDLTRSNMIKLAGNPIYKEMTIRILNTVNKIYELMKLAETSTYLKQNPDLSCLFEISIV